MNSPLAYSACEGGLFLIKLGQIYTYEQIIEIINELFEKYSEYIVIRYIGQSHDGRPIPMIRLGYGEKVLFCTAGIHGRETINPVLLVKMIEEYIYHYRIKDVMEEKFNIRKILHQYSICFYSFSQSGWI